MNKSALTSGTLRPEQLFAITVGILLLLSGFLHALVWLADGGSLAGPVSWRKPILFGVSAGITVLSMGWLVGKMRRRAGDFLLIGGFSLAMFVEVGLITMQQWRGVASHFNRSTPFDATTLSWIEWLIFFATVVIAELTRRSFGQLNVRPDMAVAIRGGICLLLFSCLLGFVLVAYGNHQVSLGRPPEVYGHAGVMRFPHGVPMHAIQFLPMLAWVLSKLRLNEQQRFNSLVYALASIVGFTVFSLAQTFSGRARFDTSVASACILAATVALAFMAVRGGLCQAARRLVKAVEHR